MRVRYRVGRMRLRSTRMVSSSSWMRFTKRPDDIRKLKDLDNPVRS